MVTHMVDIVTEEYLVLFAKLRVVKDCICDCLLQVINEIDETFKSGSIFAQERLDYVKEWVLREDLWQIIHALH